MQEIKTWILDRYKKIILVVVVGILIVVLNVLIYKSYLKKQPIIFEQTQAMNVQQLLVEYTPQVNEGKLKVNVNVKVLNELLLEYMNQAKSEDEALALIESLYYLPTEKKLYLSLKNEKDKAYTFGIESALSVTESGISFSFGRCYLGNLEVIVPSFYLNNIIGKKEELIIPFVDQNTLFSLKEVVASKDNIDLTYGYNEEAVLRAFEEYTTHVDAARVMAHDKKQDINSEYINIGKNKVASLEQVKQCIARFEENPEEIKAFSFILNEAGQKAIYEDWHTLFIQDTTLEEWYKFSENDMSEAINSYHVDFLEAFYSYLNEHRAYKIKDGTIYASGNPIAYKEVLQTIGSQDYIYDIQVEVEDNLVYAVYTVNESKIKKLILTRR